MKKRLLAVLVMAAMVVAMMPSMVFGAEAWDGTVDKTWYDDSKTVFELSNAKELAGLAELVNTGTTFQGKTIKLANDIDLNNKEWTPIGVITTNNGFMGNFDGNNYTVKNLTINDASTVPDDGCSYAGLFGITEGNETTQNTIKNLTIENVNISCTGQIVSAVIAYPYYTTVDNITVCGDINISGGSYTAGVLAYTRRCTDASNLAISGNSGSTIMGNVTVGGVIADIQMNGGLTANYSNFSASGLTISGNNNVGGISGIISEQSLTGCTVKNVTLLCSGSLVGTVAGSLGGTSTISGETIEKVTGATDIIGGNYDGSTAVEGKIGNTYYNTIEEAIDAAKNGDTLTVLSTNGDDTPIDTNGKDLEVINKTGGIIMVGDEEVGPYVDPDEEDPTIPDDPAEDPSLPTVPDDPADDTADTDKDADKDESPDSGDVAETEASDEPESSDVNELTEEPEEATDTGDDMNVVLPIVLAAAALAAMAAVVATRRRHN